MTLRMKKIVLFILIIAYSTVVKAQELSLLKVRMPAHKLAAFTLGGGRYFYSIQSVSGRDTIRTPYIYTWAGIYQDEINGEYVPYAICRTIRGRVPLDTVAVYCLDRNLSVRFKYPDGVVYAFPFKDGLSLVHNELVRIDWSFAKYGVVNRDGVLVLPMENDVLVITGGKLVSFDEESGMITCYDHKGHFLYSHRFYYPPDYYPEDIADIMRVAIYKPDVFSYEEHDYGDENEKQKNCLFKAMLSCILLDYSSAEYYLLQSMKGFDLSTRRAAKKNLKFVKSRLGEK